MGYTLQMPFAVINKRELNWCDILVINQYNLRIILV